jgi:hypothetical protein
VTSLLVAALLGLALFGLLLVFPPLYFPWALLVIVSGGIAVGLTVDPSARRGPLRAAAFSALMLAIALFVLGRMAIAPGAYVSLFLSASWLLVPAVAGALIGAAVRRRLGFVRAAVVLATGMAFVGVAGAALALVAAPAEVANAPICEAGVECARSRCWSTAERRRLYAVERVTAFSGAGSITCVYTAWGGADIGLVHDGGWVDGEWPILLGASRRR